MSAPTTFVPKWVRELQPRTEAEAEAARCYVAHLRSLVRIERGEYPAPPPPKRITLPEIECIRGRLVIERSLGEEAWQ